MRSRNEPFLAWPGWKTVAYALTLVAPLTVWWVVVYHGADRLTEVRTHRVRVHMDAELAMPFVPPFILAYLSLDVVFLAAPFVLRRRRDLQALALTLAAVTAVAGVGFLLVPAEAAYPRRDAGEWSGLFAVTRQVALRYNLVPSLHVAMAGVCLAAYGSRCGPGGKVALATWAAAIALSTLLTHQHHLLDVVTGLALAAAGKLLVYDPWRAVALSEPERRASPGPGPVRPD